MRSAFAKAKRSLRLCWIPCLEHDLQRQQGHVKSSVVFRDIAERKRIDSALLGSEARMSALFKASALGIAVTHIGNGTLIDVNNACAKLIGFVREDLLGRKTVGDLAVYTHPAQREAMVHSMAGP